MSKRSRRGDGKKRSADTPAPPSRGGVPRLLRRWTLRAVLALAAVYALMIVIFSFVAPPTNFYQFSEGLRLGGIERQWVAAERISPVMMRAAVAAEDAHFCNHWGFDMAAIRQAIARGGRRGGSTISQQVVKNVFLWHDRSWLRKALEAVLTPAVEFVWSKRRILEVYLNVAEFDEGVFGVERAAQHYFGVSAADLSALQAARLAAILPDPKHRSAARPSDFVRKRTRQIMSGAETIRVDGRAACFE